MVLSDSIHFLLCSPRLVLRWRGRSLRPLLPTTAQSRLDLRTPSQTRRRQTCTTSNFQRLLWVVAHPQGRQGAGAG